MSGAEPCACSNIEGNSFRDSNLPKERWFRKACVCWKQREAPRLWTGVAKFDLGPAVVGCIGMAPDAITREDCDFGRLLSILPARFLAPNCVAETWISWLLTPARTMRNRTRTRGSN